MTKNFSCLHCFVQGRVQGVGFRNWVQKQSIKYTFNGWVKNCENGDVEIKISGEINKIKEFLLDLKKGSVLAKVERINYGINQDSIEPGFKVIR